jgi:hypothetical protein
MAWFLTVLALIVVASPPARVCAADEFEAQAALFRYDAAADLRVEEAGVEKQGEVSVHDLRFTPGAIRSRRSSSFRRARGRSRACSGSTGWASPPRRTGRNT